MRHVPRCCRGHNEDVTDEPSDDLPLSDDQLDDITAGFSNSLAFLPESGFRGRAKVRGQDHPVALTTTVWGLCAHTHHVSQRALSHLATRDLLSAAPLARIAFESAITAQWLVQVRNSVAGFVQEQLRQQRLLAAEVLKTTWGSDMQSAAQLAARAIPEVPSVTPRRFANICEDLDPADAYVHYRWLSHFCHTSGAIVDSYATETEGREAPVLFTREPRPAHADENARLCRYLIACSNVWAAAALDWVDHEHTRRPMVRTAGRRLQISTEFRLSDEAWVRMTRAAPALKRQARDLRSR